MVGEGSAERGMVWRGVCGRIGGVAPERSQAGGRCYPPVSSSFSSATSFMYATISSNLGVVGMEVEGAGVMLRR